ncbi:MAG: TlpA disulfide reductase family protein [Planctomycetota bacterium]
MSQSKARRATVVSLLSLAGVTCAFAASSATGQLGLKDAREAMSEPLEASAVLRALPTAAILERESAHVDMASVVEPTMPDLMPGDPAPAFDVAAFVKGAPISEFEEGTAYLVDFWATWCGPCIQLIPHVAGLQDTYGDDNFQVLAVSIWEQQTGDELVDHVARFVENRDEAMRYTVAVDNNGAMAESWMKTSGQNGIPTVMLVDREGTIAWIGYGGEPEMDAAVEAVVAGEWDVARARADREATMLEEHERSKLMPWFQRFRELADSGEHLAAAQLAGALFVDGKATDPGALNSMAWTVVENEGWDRPAVEIARALAIEALEQVEWENSSVLDTLAWAEHRLGNHAEAVRVQELAIKHAMSNEERSLLADNLAIFKRSGG